MSSSSNKVKIVEVSPRDGLQNESIVLGPAVRAALIARLAGHGFRYIEAGSFVSPKIKQMGDTRDVLLHENLRELPKATSLSILVPNLRGLRDLEETMHEAGGQATSNRVSEVAVFVSATEGFSKANLNTSIDRSLAQAAEVIESAHKLGLRARGYVSCVVGVCSEPSSSMTVS